MLLSPDPVGKHGGEYRLAGGTVQKDYAFTGGSVSRKRRYLALKFSYTGCDERTATLKHWRGFTAYFSLQAAPNGDLRVFGHSRPPYFSNSKLLRNRISADDEPIINSNSPGSAVHCIRWL